MALKFMSNAQSMGNVFDKEITQKEITNWAVAGLLKAMSGEDGREQSFPEFVRAKYLENGQALGVGDEDERWKRKRGWHHFETFIFYRPKRRKRGNPEVHAGMYGAGIRKAGGDTAYLGSLNYINTSLKEPGYIRQAWRSYQGANKTKEDLQWMFVHGIEKKARETENEAV